MIQLYQGDCVARMAEMPAESVDLVLTSPPYDNLRRYGSGSTFDFEGLADQIKRTLKPGGVCVWVVGDQTKDGDESGTSFRQALHFKSIGFLLRDTMIWRKKDPFPGGDRTHYRGSFEFMFVMTNGHPKKLNLLHEPCKDAGRVRVFTRDRGRDRPRKPVVVAGTKLRSNVWDYGISKTGMGHPASFPLNLATDHVLSWTDPGDLVVDPFVGSGTVLEACLNTGRRGIGIDVDAGYLDIARRRIAAAQSATPLIPA